MIHLSYAIAQFFEIMLGAILRAVGGALAIALAIVLCVTGIVVAARHVRRKKP